MYVGSVVKIIIDLYLKNSRGVFHIASKKGMSKYDFAKAIASKFKLSAECLTESSVKDFGGLKNRGSNLELDVSKAESLLGYSFETSTEGIELAKRERLYWKEFFEQSLK